MCHNHFWLHIILSVFLEVPMYQRLIYVLSVSHVADNFSFLKAMFLNPAQHVLASCLH